MAWQTLGALSRMNGLVYPAYGADRFIREAILHRIGDPL